MLSGLQAQQCGLSWQVTENHFRDKNLLQQDNGHFEQKECRVTLRNKVKELSNPVKGAPEGTFMY